MLRKDNEPTVLRRCAMHRRVRSINSVLMVRWIFASVSTSTLLVASSSTMIRLPFKRARHSARSCFSPALKLEPCEIEDGNQYCRKSYLKIGSYAPSSPTAASRLNFASTTGSADTPSCGNNHVLRRAEMISASVRVFCGSLITVDNKHKLIKPRFLCIGISRSRHVQIFAKRS